MSRKWVEKESLQWVERGIITHEQANDILQLYRDKQHGVGLLPILGSILLGLGILSFIAANWQDISHLMRLAIIILFMAGFYGTGEYFYRSGQQKLGVALVSLGVVSFGGGIILIGQMYTLLAYNAWTFIAWAAAGAVMTYIYRSVYLFLISLLLFTIAQWHSVAEFSAFSYAAFFLMAGALGYYIWKWRSNMLMFWFSLAFVIQSLMWAASPKIELMWMWIPVMALYSAGDWLKERTIAFTVQTGPMAAAFIFVIFMVLFESEIHPDDSFLATPLAYFAALVVLFGISFIGKRRSKSEYGAVEWILLLPFAYMNEGVGLLYLLAAITFSLYVLWRGYAEQWRFKINVGTILFICSVLVAYGKLTWNYMDKSLFFIIGGVILLGLSWFLNYRNRKYLHDVKGGDGRE